MKSPKSKDQILEALVTTFYTLNQKTTSLREDSDPFANTTLADRYEFASHVLADLLSSLKVRD